jgi:glycosyltransferase involved in cell wall biosynthesis
MGSLLIFLGAAVSAAGCACLFMARIVRLSRRELRAGGIAPPPAARTRPRATVTVVMPALNEAESIGWVLEQLPEWVSEVVLVDGLSTDATEAIARQIVPDLVVVHQRTLGKGAALRAGFAVARGDIIVMLDADGSTDPTEMGRFVAALESGADFVKGSRHIGDGGSHDITRMRRLGNRGFVWLTNLIHRSDFTDLCYGYCAFWRRELGALALTADGFEIETELALHAVKAGLDVREVPSFELARRAGSSNLHPFRDGRRVLRTILAHRRWAAEAVEIGPDQTSLDQVGEPAGTGALGWNEPLGHEVAWRAVE